MGSGLRDGGGQAAVRFGFETLGLDEIVSFTVPANDRSRAVMDRLGMTRDPQDDFDHRGSHTGTRCAPRPVSARTR